MKSFIRQISLLLFALALFGCASVSPHENFKDGLYASIGYKLKDMQPGWTRESDLIGIVSLPNGNAEYQYKSSAPRPCKYMFEVDPSTGKIVGARFEGSEMNCVIYP